MRVSERERESVCVCVSVCAMSSVSCPPASLLPFPCCEGRRERRAGTLLPRTGTRRRSRRDKSGSSSRGSEGSAGRCERSRCSRSQAATPDHVRGCERRLLSLLSPSISLSLSLPRSLTRSILCCVARSRPSLSLTHIHTQDSSRRKKRRDPSPRLQSLSRSSSFLAPTSAAKLKWIFDCFLSPSHRFRSFLLPK